MHARTTVVTLATPEIEEYSKITLPTHERWCRMHNYKFAPSDSNLVSPRQIIWQKLLLIAWAIADAQPDDTVVWLDADTIITSPNTALETILPRAHQAPYGITATQDRNGFNAGVMVCRPTSALLALLHDAWQRHDLDAHPYREQEALKQAAQKAPGMLKYVPKRLINSYPEDWRPGDLICHLAGCDQKPGLAKHFRQRAEPPAHW